MDIREIQQFLPHRYPMLMVDRIDELELGKRVRGYKNVTVNEPFFQGHFPGLPIMPGVLIIESMAQVSAAMLLANPKFTGYTPIVVALDKVKFKRPVMPGDQLVTEAESLWFRRNLGSIRAVATVDGNLVAEALIAFKVIKDGDSI